MDSLLVDADRSHSFPRIPGVAAIVKGGFGLADPLLYPKLELDNADWLNKNVASNGGSILWRIAASGDII